MSPSTSNCPLGLAGSLLPVVQGMHPSNKGGDKSPSLQSWQLAPKKCCRNLKLRYGTLRQFSRKQFCCAGTDSVDWCPKAEPREQRGLTLYTLARSLQKQKAGSNPYMVTCTHIGYITLVLRDFFLPPAPVLWGLLCIWIS
jgi:hypothetical protein